MSNTLLDRAQYAYFFSFILNIKGRSVRYFLNKPFCLPFGCLPGCPGIGISSPQKLPSVASASRFGEFLAEV